MTEAHKTSATSPDRGIPRAGSGVAGLTIVWPVLAISYLAASASGYRSVALTVVGLMIGVLVAASGHRLAGAILGLGLSSACLYWSNSLLFMAYLPPIAGFAFMAFFFQCTLRPGSEPLITRVARKEHPALPPEIARYTRTLTWIWVWCFVLMLVVALLLAPMLPLHSWSRWMQVMAAVVPATLFLGEYTYRHHHLRDHRHASLLTLMFNIITVIKEAAIKAPISGPQH